MVNRAAESAENKKNIKYAALEENYIFQPLAFETMGCFGPLTKKTMNLIGELIKNKSGDKLSAKYLKKRISIALQKGNTKTVLFSLCD